ncbi:hypothetical protein HELRODRAFT_124468, partial [Helobdella robusta]|uniref:Major facilitator superfamily (MFS) profile domain-containing protein n=1 Tax=Helobdella robusta TaxID=6412 RepID=T1EH16_HELRO
KPSGGLKIPWKKILLSLPCWAIIVAHSCNNWANYTILVCLPLFMKEVMELEVQQNGLYTSLPYVFSFLMAILSGHVSDLLIRRKWLSVANTRKLLQTISSVIPAILLIVVGYLDKDDVILVICLLCVIVSVNALCRSGMMVNHIDIAPRYSGILLGISNTVATVPGILGPAVVGWITTNVRRDFEWQTVFQICSVLLLFSSIFYCIFAQGELQEW